MEYQTTFKTRAFGGFDKKSVLRYIDELSAENRAALNELNQKIAEMEQCRGSLNETVAGLNQQVDGMQRTLEQRDAQVKDLRSTVESLNAELARRRDEADGRERELRVQQEKCRQLTLRAETLEYKGKKYDEAVSHIGNALLEAQQSAGGIIRAAEEQAARLTFDAVEGIRGLAEQIDVFRSDVCALRATMRSSLADLEQRLDAIDGSICVLDEAVKSVERARAEAAAEAEEPAAEEEPEPGAEAEPRDGEAGRAPEEAGPGGEEPPEPEDAPERRQDEPVEQTAPATEFFW